MASNSLRVGMICYGLDSPARVASGIGRYTLELLEAFGVRQPQVELTLLTGSPWGGASRLQVARLPGCRLLPGLVTLGNLWLPMLARGRELDVVHDPTGVTPFLLGAGGARTVVTVHDVFAWSCPGHSTWLDTLIYRYWLPQLLPRVDMVITDSQASRADIERYLRIPAEKITVVYPGVSASYRPLRREHATRTAAQYGLPEGYLLFVGSVEERKNLRRLLQACASLWKHGERRPLVVVGALKWKYSAIMKVVEELDLEQRVIFTGHVQEADLPALYSAADLLVFPSLCEGFGLPPLEAMACGTPVVCSDAASLPEAVGDAAVMVDPLQVEALAQTILHVLTDERLQEELRQKGLVRARQFTWERTARQVIAVYREVLACKR